MALVGLLLAGDPKQERLVRTGAVQVEGHIVMFKIDYHGLDLQYASPDLADPNVTRRVMTLMLAEEY
jgi:hypothetical protein